MKNIEGEIFVVDNASDDGSVEMLHARFPLITVIANNENLGFAKANNQALQRSRGKYLLILNPDTLLQEDTITTMIRFLDENSDVGIAGSKIIQPDGTIEPACRRSFPSPWVSFTKLAGLSNLFPKSRFFGKYNLTYLSDDETYEVDAISGCFMMIRRDVYDEIGGFDESYFMYGEDLDLCYRTQKAGWKIYYVHATKIIHYGGESTKRSSIDVKAVFYEAMKLFVQKNLELSALTTFIINVAIQFRFLLSRIRNLLVRSKPVFTDNLFVFFSLLVAELIRFGSLFNFPSYAYPTVYIASAIIYSLCLSISGVYSSTQNRVARAAFGCAASFLLMSALIFFFKDFAFSRVVVLVSNILLFLLLPSRRAVDQIFGSRVESSLITGRPTLIIGITDRLAEILHKLKNLPGPTYRIVGIIDLNRKHIGDVVHHIPIVGSVANIGKIILEKNIADVIILPDVLAYSEIVAMMSRTKGQGVHYRLVARNMEAIVGKAGIDQLTPVPLIEVEFNLIRLSHRIEKRVSDVLLSLLGLMTLFPFVFFFRKNDNGDTLTFSRMILSLPDVFLGKKSLVGRYSEAAVSKDELYLGKPGVTGLAHLQRPIDLSKDEILNLDIHYARNHTIFLDSEILIRTLAYFLRLKSIPLN